MHLKTAKTAACSPTSPREHRGVAPVVSDMRPIRALVVCLGAMSAFGAVPPAGAAPYCHGDYAEDLSALSPEARDLESKTPPYSYAVRTSAVYECVSYGTDGNLKKHRMATTAYGTAFGLRSDGNDTLLVTNQHVAEWAAVTDDDHPEEGVPSGCKRISDTQTIVDDDHDEYAADDVPLTHVVSDPALDISLMRAHAKLQVIPWRIGRSAGVAARDAVEVKGFPLGELRATNVGKVISAYSHDTDGDWSHDDFVVDALLSRGGSGSPVLAISCATGEFELVGVFHAHYNGAAAMNLVIAVDQLDDLLATLKRSIKPATDPWLHLDATTRAQVAEAVRSDPAPPFFAVGPLVASVRARADGALVFAVFGNDFPQTTTPLLAIEDWPATDPKQFGKPGAIYISAAQGLSLYAPVDADSDTQAAIARTLDLLRTDALAAFNYRRATRLGARSRDAAVRLSAKKRSLVRLLVAQHDSGQEITDLVGRVATESPDVTVPLSEIETGLPAVATSQAPRGP